MSFGVPGLLKLEKDCLLNYGNTASKRFCLLCVCWFLDIPIRLLGLRVVSGLEEWAFNISEEGTHKPHDFSMCTCAVGLQRLYLRDTLEAQSRMWQPFIYPQRLQFQPGCKLAGLCAISSLGPSSLQVSCFLFWTMVCTWVLLISTEGLPSDFHCELKVEGTWLVCALGMGGERCAWLVSLLVLPWWRLPRADWGWQRQYILQNSPSGGWVDCLYPMPCQACAAGPRTWQLLTS